MDLTTKSMWSKEMDVIVNELIALDRTNDYAIVQQRLQGILKSLQEFTNADRVYIFEELQNNSFFTNTYEYCKEGVIPQIGNLQVIYPMDMPNWYKNFCNASSIVIENIEDIVNLWPEEYEILSKQDIHSEISLPFFYHEQLIGFLGLDNPDIQKSNDFISMLRLLGAHLSSVYSTFHVEKLLKANQDNLDQEKQFLSVLTRDFTSVYFLDLKEHTLRALKYDLYSKKFASFTDYESYLEYFIENDVASHSRDYVQKKLSISNICKVLKVQDRVTYRFEVLPNRREYRYFEVQISKIDDASALLAFQHIDDLVTEEQRRQDELQINLDIISAIGKIYYSIFRINLETDFYEEVSNNAEMHMLTGNNGKASTKLLEICDQFVAEQYQKGLRSFFDLHTLPMRLRNEDTVAVEYLAKDGNWHLARFIAKNRNENNRVTKVLYCTRIISDAKRKEQNMIVMAEEANRQNAAKTDFLSRMSHDIRTPLNAICGYIELLKGNIDNKEVALDNLHKMDLASKYLSSLVEDVLDLTRIDTGKMNVCMENISIHEVFDDLCNIVDIIRNNRAIHMHYSIHDIIEDRVISDATLLQQIFLNLLSNAIKYTHKEGDIWFEIYQTKKQDGYVSTCFIVKDTGIGMSEEYMKIMYEKFTRAIDTRVNKVRGSGLGLAIVKQLVDLLQGNIQVRSKINEGTCFTLIFDFACQKKDVKQDEDHQYHFDGAHVLIAEDNDINYEVESELLQMYNIDCTRACNGKECVNFMKDDPNYDCILMDMQMPEMDGLEAAKEIRKFNRSVPIIAVTANAFETDIQNCLQAGMNAHLSKPFDVDKLMQLLSKFYTKSNV